MPFGLPNPLKGKSKGIYRALPDSPSSPSFPKPKPYNRNTLYDPAPNPNPPLAPAPARNPRSGRPGSSPSTACLPGTPRHGPLIDLDPYSEDEEEDTTTTARQVGELRVEMRELEGLEFSLNNPGMTGEDTFIKVDAPGPVREDGGRGKGKPADFGNTALDMLRGARNDAAWRVRLLHQDDLKRKKEEEEEEAMAARMRGEVENERKKMGYMAGIGAPSPRDQEGDSVLFDSDEFAELEENVFEDEGMEVVDYDDDEDEAAEEEAKAVDEVGEGKKKGKSTTKGKYNADLTRGSRYHRADSPSSVSSHSSDDSWCSTSDIAPSDDECADEEEKEPAVGEGKKKTLAAKLLALARKKKKAAAAKPKAMDIVLAKMVSEEAGVWAEVSGSFGLEDAMGKIGIPGELMSTEGRRGGGGSSDEVDLVVDENYFA